MPVINPIDKILLPINDKFSVATCLLYTSDAADE